MPPHALAELLRSAHPAAERWPADEDKGIERALRLVLDEAARAWPGIQVSGAAFVRHLARHLPDSDAPAAAIVAMRTAELYLCCACAAGDERAVAELERRYLPAAVKAVGCLDIGADARAEALQLLRAKLMVCPEDQGAAIEQFAGRGSLEGWLRTMAVRTALNSLRPHRREVPGEDSLLAQQVAGDGRDPELDYIKEQYRDELQAAMAQAFARLAADQRELLRLYVIEGLTLDELGQLNEVNASTVSRWLARIRDKLASDARRCLVDQGRMRPSECESLMGVLQSGMHLSVQRLLEPPIADPQ